LISAGGKRGGFVFNEFIRFEDFDVDFINRWDAVVSLEEGRGAAAELDDVGVHVPDRVEHGILVGAEDVLLELGVPGDERSLA
jgi:hypothetical protein